MRKKHNKISKYIIVFLIFFLTFLLFNYYSNKLNPKVVEVAEKELQKWTKNFLSTNIGYNILSNKNIDDILIINKDNDDQILYVDYKLDNAYKILEDITNEIMLNIDELTYGKSINDNIVKSNGHSLYLQVPLFIASNNIILSNLGPKLFLPINFIGSILTNIKTDITSYGMNNALVEMYVTMVITEELMTPVTKNDMVIEYDVLIAAKVINGRVPEFYASGISTKSNILSIPME